MKKIIAIVLAAVLLVGVFIFSVYYRNQKNIEQHQSLQALSTHESNEEETKNNSSKEPVVVTDDSEYEIYYDGEIVTIVKDDYSLEVENWAQSFDMIFPTAVSKDVDGDNVNELLLKVFSNRITNGDGTETNLFSVFMFKPYVNEEGEKTFIRAVANSSTWIVPFEQTVRAEVTQLKDCKKLLQFAMADISDEIKYDEKGLSSNDYVGYAKAIKDNTGQYYTLADWELGQGIYNLDEDGNVTLKIQVVAEFTDAPIDQIIGFINCDIQYKEGAFSIVPKKINFEAQDQYKVADPREESTEKWTAKINNSGTDPDFKNKNIDWLEMECSVNNLGKSQNINFDTYSSKIKCVETVNFTQSSITLTAKDGYEFSANVAKKGDFSVVLNEEDAEGVDVGYKCEIKTVNSKSTLVITFDRSYSKEQLGNITIKFGG